MFTEEKRIDSWRVGVGRVAGGGETALSGCWWLESGEETPAPSEGQVGPESNTHSHPRAFPAEMTLTCPPPGTGGQLYLYL